MGNHYIVKIPFRTSGRIEIEFSPDGAWRWAGVGLVVASLAGSVIIASTQPEIALLNPATWLVGLVGAGFGVLIAGKNSTCLSLDLTSSSVVVEDRVLGIWPRRVSYPFQQVEALGLERAHDSDDGEQDHLVLRLHSKPPVKILNLYATATLEQREAVRLAQNLLEGA